MTTPAVIEISHPDRVIFPEDGITKADLASYYGRVADLMVPLIAGRPIVLERYPGGIGAKGFLQKDVADAAPPWLATVEVPRRRGGSVRHALIDDATALRYVVNLGTVTPHVFLTRADDLDHPDQLMFDLDPSDDPTAVVPAARNLRRLLDELGLPSFTKLSGSRGIHVHVPIARTLEVDQANAVAYAIASTLVDRHPDELTVEHRKEARAGRLFVDTLRNGYAQHAAAPYAVRPRPGGPVAMPVEWDEVRPGLDPGRYTIRNAFRRLGRKSDPWSGFEASAVDKTAAAWDDLARSVAPEAS